MCLWVYFLFVVHNAKYTLKKWGGGQMFCFSFYFMSIPNAYSMLDKLVSAITYVILYYSTTVIELAGKAINGNTDIF